MHIDGHLFLEFVGIVVAIVFNGWIINQSNKKREVEMASRLAVIETSITFISSHIGINLPHGKKGGHDT